MQVNLADLGLNVLFDLLNFASKIDNLALQEVNGKSIKSSSPMTVADMTIKGMTRR